MAQTQLEKQTDNQKQSKSPLYGYRKPIFDGYATWCACTVPHLVSNRGIGGGQAYCLRCGFNWYN